MPRKLTTKAITDDAITADKIVAGAVTADIPSQGISTDKIADLGVTHAKLHNTMDLSGKTVTLPSLSNLNIGGTGTQAKLEVNTNVSNAGSLTNTAINIATAATTGNKANIGFGLAGGVANTNTATIGLDITSGAGATEGDLFFSTRTGTGDTVPTERLRIKSSGRVGIADADPDSMLHVSGNVKVGSAASSAWAASSHDAGGLDVFVGSGSHALQLWDDNYQSRPRFEVGRDGHVWAGQNMQFHEDNTSTTAPFNITNSSSTENFFNITTYGAGSVNETYRHCYNINADAHWVHFTGGGGNTVFTTTAYIGGEHYKDITVWTITQYYSDLKIKVVQSTGSGKSIWVAGNTYNNNVYNLRWRVTPIRPCAIEHNPSSSESAVYHVHHASGGEQFTSTSGAASGTGPSTY